MHLTKPFVWVSRSQTSQSSLPYKTMSGLSPSTKAALLSRRFDESLRIWNRELRSLLIAFANSGGEVKNLFINRHLDHLRGEARHEVTSNYGITRQPAASWTKADGFFPKDHFLIRELWLLPPLSGPEMKLMEVSLNYVYVSIIKPLMMRAAPWWRWPRLAITGVCKQWGLSSIDTGSRL